MATKYVATDGNDSNDGSSGSPWATLDHAIDTVSNDDIIQLAAGTYAEDSINDSEYSKTGLTIKGAAGATVILQGDGSSSYGINTGNGWTIQNIRFTNYGTAGYSVIRLADAGFGGITIQDCYFYSNTGAGVVLGGTGSNTVRRCYFLDIIGDGVTYTCPNSTVENCVFVNVESIAVDASNAACTGTTIQHNTCYACGWQANYVLRASRSGSNIKYNLVQYCPTSTPIGAYAAANSQYNYVIGGEQNFESNVLGTGDKEVMVDFKDITTIDLRPSFCSEVLEAATSSGVSVDVNNASRPTNKAIGAFERDSDAAPWTITKIYVNKTSGDDANDGTSGSPYATIQKAVDVIATNTTYGRTIEIQDTATYYETVIANPSIDGSTKYAKAIRIRGADDATVTLKITTANPKIKPAEGWFIENITFDGDQDGAGNFAAVDQYSSGNPVYFQNCIFKNHDNNVNHWCIDAGNGSIIDKCTFHDNIKLVQLGSGSIVQNSLFYDCTYGLNNLNNSWVLHCTMDDISDYGTYALLAGHAHYNIIANSVGAAGQLRAIKSHTYNCSYNGSATDIYGGAGTGDITTDPLFTDASADDFSLQATSPCIAPGAALESLADRPVAMLYDHSGAARHWTYGHKFLGVDDSTMKNPDMGCHEFAGTKANGVDANKIKRIMGVDCT